MKKGILKTVFATALVGIMAFSVVGCAKKNDSTGATGTTGVVDKIKKSGKLVLATSADYPPYEFIDSKGNKIGFDIEIAKAIANKLGVKLEISDMKFDGLIAALKTNKADLVIAGMNPTAERMQSVDFSNIYYTATQYVVVRAEDKAKYASLDSLAGKAIGVQKGSVQEGLAKDQIKDSQRQSVPKIPDVILNLKNKKVEAAIVEGPVAKLYVSKNSDLAISDSKFDLDPSEQGSAIAVAKGSEDLLKVINETLDELKKDNKIDQLVIDATNAVE
jgi:polar amino acid transport system substrate-binding protein